MAIDPQKIDAARKIFDKNRKGTLWTKRNIILAVLALAYVLSPIDLVPEVIFPLVGWLDDMGILAAVAMWILSSRSITNSEEATDDQEPVDVKEKE